MEINVFEFQFILIVHPIFTTSIPIQFNCNFKGTFNSILN